VRGEVRKGLSFFLGKISAGRGPAVQPHLRSPSKICRRLQKKTGGCLDIDE